MLLNSRVQQRVDRRAWLGAFSLRPACIRQWAATPGKVAAALTAGHSSGSLEKKRTARSSKQAAPPAPLQDQGRPTSPLDGLNEEQTAAALSTAQVVRVKAGPGSGKTRVVVARCHNLIKGCDVKPPSILAITFTNKAGNELKERLAAAGCGGGPEGAPVAKTFHGLGAMILRQSVARAPELGVDERFKIIDADQSEKLLRRAVTQVDQLQQPHHYAESSAAVKDTSGKASPAGKPAASRASAASRVAPASAGGPRTPPPSPSSTPPLPVLTTKATFALAERLADLLPNLKAQLAAARHFDDSSAVAAARHLGLLVDSGSAAGAARGAVAVPRHAAPPRRSSADTDDKLADKQAVAARWHQEQLQEYYLTYQQLLRSHNAFDFADLICMPVRLLDQRQDLAAAWRSRYTHILVDEFQDTDPAQYLLVKLLLFASTSLFVVGDPDQAIYGWRGAEVGNMKNFLPEDFDTTTYMLTHNFRSDPQIVAGADAMLCAGGRPELYSKAIAARSPSTQPGAVMRHHVYPTPEAEAAAVASRVIKWANSGELGRGPERRMGEVAVLYRTRAQSRPLEEVFVRKGIPFTVVGGQPYWQYKEVADAVAYLQVLLEPRRSDLFLERIINEPKRGVGDTTVKTLIEAARARGMTLGALLFDGCDGDQQEAGGTSGGPPAWATATAADDDPAVYAPDLAADSALKAAKPTKAALRGIQGLRGLVCRLRWMAAAGASVSVLLTEALRLSGYEAALQLAKKEGEGKKSATNKKKDVATEMGERLERLGMLEVIVADSKAWISDEDEQQGELAATGGAAADGLKAVGLAGLARFLEHAALVTGQDTDAKSDGNSVRLMTLHSAKGLEFKRVFIVGLEEDILPSGRSKTDPERLAEERRLFYVGITRAKDQLYLSRCQDRFMYGERKAQQQPSSFLKPLGLKPECA